MNQIDITSLIEVNSTSITLEGVRQSDGTCDGSTLEDLLHHCLFALNGPELVNSVDQVLIGDEAWGATRLAVLANVDRCAFNAIVMTASLVDRTGLISHIRLVDEVESAQGLTAMAPIIVHGA
jgi:hypothetical protein